MKIFNCITEVKTDYVYELVYINNAYWWKYCEHINLDDIKKSGCIVYGLYIKIRECYNPIIRNPDGSDNHELYRAFFEKDLDTANLYENL